MKRFVTYLYEYDRGVRGRNAGFVRTDIRDDAGRMELHIRGLDRYKGKDPVYLVIAEKSPEGVAVGEILISQGMGNLILSFPKLRIGPSPYSLDQLQALIIRLGNGKLLAGSFVKEPAEGILKGDFSPWTENPAPKPQPPVPESKTPLPEKADTPSNIPPESEAARETDLLSELETSEDTDLLPEPETSEDTDLLPKPETSEKPGDAISQEKNTISAESLPSPDIKDVEKDEITYRRIELTDIRSLPPRNWYLSNNRFVVHGFFNYHYLLLKTVVLPEGRKRYLGVPGIYEQPERMMALLFGFPEFELSEEAKRSRPQSDTDLTGAFGYWICPVSEE